jgi:hypothetical protein
MRNKDQEGKRAKAKLNAAIDAMRPMLREALQAAHELLALQNQDEDEGYVDFDHVMHLGYVVDSAGHLCGPALRVLDDLIRSGMLDHDDDNEQPEQAETRAH